MRRRRESVNAAGDLDLRPACPAFLAAFAPGAGLSAPAAAGASSHASAVAAALSAPAAGARPSSHASAVAAALGVLAARRALERRRVGRRSPPPVWRRLAHGLARSAPGSRPERPLALLSACRL